jgi:hypothetical protein
MGEVIDPGSLYRHLQGPNATAIPASQGSPIRPFNPAPEAFPGIPAPDFTPPAEPQNFSDVTRELAREYGVPEEVVLGMLRRQGPGGKASAVMRTQKQLEAAHQERAKMLQHEVRGAQLDRQVGVWAKEAQERVNHGALTPVTAGMFADMKRQLSPSAPAPVPLQDQAQSRLRRRVQGGSVSGEMPSALNPGIR